MALTTTSKDFTKASTFTLNLASIPANTTATQSVAVAGVVPGNMGLISCDALESGLIISNIRVAVAGTLKFDVGNVTVSAIDAASHVFNYVVL